MRRNFSDTPQVGQSKLLKNWLYSDDIPKKTAQLTIPGTNNY